MAPKVEKILEGFTLGEGPHWDHKNQCLYFVDILASTIHKYVPANKRHTQVKIGNHNVSIVIPIKDKENQFLITVDRSVAILEWDGESTEAGSIKKLYTVEEDTEHVFNDGKCDRTGRLWTGTMSSVASSVDKLEKNQGALYSFSKNHMKAHRGDISISNGIAFDYDRGKMYYIDTFSYGIDQYDIDLEDGNISNEETIFRVPENGDIFCDGMTIDTDGNLWVAMFGKSAVDQIDPRTGNIIQTVNLPAYQITSVAFGGPKMDELYVTSGAIKDRPFGESPGSVFRVTGLLAKGLPADEAVF